MEKILKGSIFSSFAGRVFLCPDCGREINWYEECEYCNYEPDNNGQF